MKISRLVVSLQMAALSGGLFFGSQSVQAKDYVWSGSGAVESADWFASKNWKVAGSDSKTGAAQKSLQKSSDVPGAGDTATISAGAVVTIDKPLTLSALTVEEGSTLQGTGDVTVTSTLTLRDARLTGDGDLVISEDATAILSGEAGGKGEGNSFSKGIDNRGDLKWNSGKLSLKKDFHNRGNFTVAADATMESVGAGKSSFHNLGKLFKSGANQTAIAVPFNNSGDIYLRAGTLDVGPNYVQSDGSLNLDGGSLSSSGTLQIAGGVVGGTGTLDCDVVNNGTFKPGHSPGYIYINGNFTQTTNGTLGMEVGGVNPGTGYDQLEVTGRVELAGTLDILKYNNYMPFDGQGMDFIKSWDMHGGFTSYSGQFPGNSLYYRLFNLSSSYYASVGYDGVRPTIAITSPVHLGRYLGVTSIQGTAYDDQSDLKYISVSIYRYATSTTPTGFLLANNTWTSTWSAANQLVATGKDNWRLNLPALAPGQYHARASAYDNVNRTNSTSNIIFVITPSGSGYVMAPGAPGARPRLTLSKPKRELRFPKSF